MHNFMVYDEGLANRISELFSDLLNVKEKKLFGGIVYVVNGNLVFLIMSCGIVKEELMVRVGKEKYNDFLSDLNNLVFSSMPEKWISPEDQ